MIIKIIQNIKNPVYQDVARLQILSGARAGEILTIRREFIDLDFKSTFQTTQGPMTTEGVYILVSGKSGDRHILFPNESKVIFKKYIKQGIERGFIFLKSGMEELKISDEGRFYKKIDSIRTLYHRSLTRSARQVDGAPRNFGTHELRRCFADKAYKEGATIYELKNLLGHQDINTTILYIPKYEDNLIRIASNVHNRFLHNKKATQ